MSDYIASETGPDAAPIESFDQLVAHFERGAKPRSAWRVGTEYEKVAVDRSTGRAIPYSGPNGVEALLRGLADRFGWEPHEEEGRIIGLGRDGVDITLEPGGQVELSGRLCRNLHEANAELQEHIHEITSVGDALGIAFLGLGIQPVSSLDEIETVPKKRYGIMGPYMAKVGRYGQRMMKQTATVQVNLDYSSEADALRKMRVATGVGPVINAIFANSSICEGRAMDMLSFRGHIWTDTDASRCGILPFLFSAHAGFADYIEWALDAPMYFVKRRGEYLNMTGVPFRRYWKEGFDGQRATVGDFALHLSTLFPEVRLKTYIELRMVDSQPTFSLLALSALAKGILYDDDCIEAAWDLVKDWSLSERVALWKEGHRLALAAPVRRYRLQELAKELVEIAEEGLRRQAAVDGAGDDERKYLLPAREFALSGRPPGLQILERWNREWHGDVSKLVRHVAYPSPGAEES